MNQTAFCYESGFLRSFLFRRFHLITSVRPLLYVKVSLHQDVIFVISTPKSNTIPQYFNSLYAPNSCRSAFFFRCRTEGEDALSLKGKERTGRPWGRGGCRSVPQHSSGTVTSTSRHLREALFHDDIFGRWGEVACASLCNDKTVFCSSRSMTTSEAQTTHWSVNNKSRTCFYRLQCHLRLILTIVRMADMFPSRIHPSNSRINWATDCSFSFTPLLFREVLWIQEARWTVELIAVQSQIPAYTGKHSYLRPQRGLSHRLQNSSFTKCIVLVPRHTHTRTHTHTLNFILCILPASWGKDGRCVGLTTLPSSCADCLEILKP
jgi:hypothetical protein